MVSYILFFYSKVDKDTGEISKYILRINNYFQNIFGKFQA